MTIDTEHNDYVTYISQLDNNKLISCSNDQTIKIWSISQASYQCDYTIQDAHDDVINKVITLSNNRIASCSYDHKIKIWNSIHPYIMIKTFEGHIDYVKSIIHIKENDVLISGGSDRRIGKWSLSTYQCDKIIKHVDCSYSNSIIEIDNNRIIVGGNKVITIINISNYIIEHKILEDKLDSVYSLNKLRGDNILCGYGNGSLCIYDINNHTLLFKNDTIHDKVVSCLLNINKYKFVSCSYDNTIKIWEY